MINSDYIIFHLFEIYYHVLDKFSSNENNFNFIFFKDFLIKLGWYLKWPLEDMLTFHLTLLLGLYLRNTLKYWRILL